MKAAVYWQVQYLRTWSDLDRSQCHDESLYQPTVAEHSGSQSSQRRTGTTTRRWTRVYVVQPKPTPKLGDDSTLIATLLNFRIPKVAKFYKDAETFTCISHPAIQVPFSSVNDDFCDCPDGSDEPGTAACSHLSIHSPLSVADRPGNHDLELVAALPGFYCKNKGHRPSYVPSQRVNDGICDYELCCDGSDEWARVGGTKCEDKCKEIGREWRKQDEKRQKSMTAALKKKRELLVDAARKQQEIEENVRRLETELQGAEVKARNLDKELEELRSQERSKRNGRLQVLVEIAKERVEGLRGGLVEVRQERDDARARVKELEGVLGKLKDERDPNTKDEGVKQAVGSWDEYVSRGLLDHGNSARDRDLDHLVKPDDDSSGVNWEHWENVEESCEFDTREFFFLILFFPQSPRSLDVWLTEQSTNLRRTSRHLWYPSWRSSLLPSEASSNSTASWRKKTAPPAPNPKRCRQPAKVPKQHARRSARPRNNFGHHAKTSRSTTARRLSSGPCRAGAYRATRASTRTSTAFWTRRSRTPRKAAGRCAWASLSESAACTSTRPTRPAKSWPWNA